MSHYFPTLFPWETALPDPNVVYDTIHGGLSYPFSFSVDYISPWRPDAFSSDRILSDGTGGVDPTSVWSDPTPALSAHEEASPYTDGTRGDTFGSVPALHSPSSPSSRKPLKRTQGRAGARSGHSVKEPTVPRGSRRSSTRARFNTASQAEPNSSDKVTGGAALDNVENSHTQSPESSDGECVDASASVGDAPGVPSPVPSEPVESVEVFICGYPDPNDPTSSCCACCSTDEATLIRHRGSCHYKDEQERRAKGCSTKFLVFGGTLGPFRACDVNGGCCSKLFNRKCAWKRHVKTCNGRKSKHSGRNSAAGAKDSKFTWVATSKPRPRIVRAKVEKEGRYNKVVEIYEILDTYDPRYVIKKCKNGTEADVDFLTKDEDGGVAFYHPTIPAIVWTSWREDAANNEEVEEEDEDEGEDDENEDEAPKPAPKGKRKRASMGEGSSRKRTRRS